MPVYHNFTQLDETLLQVPTLEQVVCGQMTSLEINGATKIGQVIALQEGGAIVYIFENLNGLDLSQASLSFQPSLGLNLSPTMLGQVFDSLGRIKEIPDLESFSESLELQTEEEGGGEEKQQQRELENGVLPIQYKTVQDLVSLEEDAAQELQIVSGFSAIDLLSPIMTGQTNLLYFPAQELNFQLINQLLRQIHVPYSNSVFVISAFGLEKNQEQQLLQTLRETGDLHRSCLFLHSSGEDLGLSLPLAEISLLAGQYLACLGFAVLNLHIGLEKYTSSLQALPSYDSDFNLQSKLVKLSNCSGFFEGEMGSVSQLWLACLDQDSNLFQNFKTATNQQIAVSGNSLGKDFWPPIDLQRSSHILSKNLPAQQIEFGRKLLEKVQISKELVPFNSAYNLSQKQENTPLQPNHPLFNQGLHPRSLKQSLEMAQKFLQKEQQNLL